MVNSGNPSNDCASLRSYYNHRKASQEPQPPSEQPTARNFFSEIFLQPQLRCVDTPLGSPKPILPTNGRIFGNRCPTRRRMRARGFFSDRRTSSLELRAADLQAYVPGFLIQHLNHPLLSISFSEGIYFKLLLDFSSKSDTTEAPLTI